MTSYTQALLKVLVRLDGIDVRLVGIGSRLDSIEEAIGSRLPTVNSGFDGNCEGTDDIGQECLKPPVANLNGKFFCQKHLEDAFIELRRLQEMVIDALAPMEAAMKAQGES